MLLCAVLMTVTAWADTYVITSSNFHDYFDENGYLKSTVPAESTLDFQGEFQETMVEEQKTVSYSLYINKRVTITSSDKSAVFKSADGVGDDNITVRTLRFIIMAGADYTEVKNLKFRNCGLLVRGASHVTIDGIDFQVNGVRVNPGMGALSIQSEDAQMSDHATIKNSTFYFTDNGTSSCIVYGCGAPYTTIEGNTITLDGENVGNGVYGSLFNAAVNLNEAPEYKPEYATIKNNVINHPGEARTTSWCLIVCGRGNLVESNTINYKGVGIIVAFVDSGPANASGANIYRENTINDGGSMTVHPYSVVEENTISGALTVDAGSTVKNNTVGGKVTVKGANAVVENNTFNNSVTISNGASNITFTNNNVNGTVTANSTGNTIRNNIIISTDSYAVDIKGKSNNDVQYNILNCSGQVGDAAVKNETGSGTTVANNVGGTQITSADGNVIQLWTEGWYYVSGEVTINGELILSSTIDDVNLILCDNAKLVINGGTREGAFRFGKALTIHAQSTGEHMGQLEINCEGAGIIDINKDRTLTINGGNIHLKGYPDHAGMVGLWVETITINGGNITIDNYQYGIEAVLIELESSGSLTINGGTITTDKDLYAYNDLTINGGQLTMSKMKGEGNVVINGGQVTVTGDDGITAGNNITLNWTDATDFIESPKYSADGISASKFFEYDGGIIPVGTVDASTINGKKLMPLVHPLLKNNLANANVTFYDAGTTAPTASTFDADNPGTELTADDVGNYSITPGHYVVMYVQPEDGYWTDAQLLSCRETNGGTTVSDSRAVTFLARKTDTDYRGDTYTYYNGAGWYCYQVPAANTVDAGYTQSELNGDVVAKFDLDAKNNITQNGKVVTVTDGTDDGWSAVLTVDEVSYKFDGNKHQPKYTSIVIKKGDVTKITLTDATFIGELLHELNKGTTIDRYYLDIWSKSNYGWFSGDCWGDITVAGFDITVPLSTAKSYDANDPTTILGCETNPWLITSATELNLLAKCVNIGRYTFKGEYLKVTENIDMSEIDDFMPIGTNASFCGTFDGNSKTISNLSLVLAPDNDEEEDDMGLIPVGLFGEVGYVKYEWDDETPAETPVPAVVKNFTLQDCIFNDGGYSLWTGGVAGQVKKGSTISGVTLKGCTIQSSAFPRIMPIDDVLGYVVPRVGGVAGESVGLIENCTVEDCTISSQVTKLEPVPSDEEMHLDAPTQWNVVGGIVGTTIKSTEEMPELELQAKRRAPAQQLVSESRRRLRDNSIELGLTGNRVKGATTITSDIAGDVVSPVGAIFGELENGTVLSDNKYGLNVTVTRKMGSQETTTTTAKGYIPRGLTGLKDNDLVFKDITENEGAMMEVYPVTISPVAAMTGYTMPNPLAEVTATEALEAGKNCYQIVEGTPYFAPTDNINLAVAATQITKKEDGRNLHADLALKMNSDDLTVTNGVATFTMPETAATVTGTFTEASWFTVDTNNKKWMSFYHEWMTATDDKTGAGGQTPVAANYTVTDASENVNTPKTIVVKTVSNVNTKNGDVTMSDLAGVSFNGVPTLFSCQDGLPAQLRFTPNTTATKPATWAQEFKGVKEDTEMTGKDGVYIMNGSGDFIYAVITPADNTLAAHRCYIDMDNVTGGAPLRIVEEEEPTGIETTDNGQPTTDSWYTLSGVKLDEKPVVKGVYIHNGKKVVIK